MSSASSSSCWIAFPRAVQGKARSLESTSVQGVELGAWLALQFTPRVSVQEDAFLLEISGSVRLWGGAEALWERLSAQLVAMDLACSPVAQGRTPAQALAVWRLQQAGISLPQRLPLDLPLHTLAALQPHVGTLAQIGCNTWGDLEALPRGGVARRFGAKALQALDEAMGRAPHGLLWERVPETFDVTAELPSLADSGSALLHASNRCLQALQAWLQSREQGLLALEFSWQHELRRYEGVDLPAWQAMVVRTAQPTQDMAHVRRLLSEHLARTRMAAPAHQIRLHLLQSAPWMPASPGLLDTATPGSQGMAWHELVERLGARLGPDKVQVLETVNDHRPEAMQRWRPAVEMLHAQGAQASVPAVAQAWLWPTWLVNPPRLLAVRRQQPCYHGPLDLLVGPHRLETAWWEEPDAGHPAAVRDYFVAHNDTAGLVWIYRERLAVARKGQDQERQGARWFLQGRYG